MAIVDVHSSELADGECTTPNASTAARSTALITERPTLQGTRSSRKKSFTRSDSASVISMLSRNTPWSFERSSSRMEVMPNRAKSGSSSNPTRTNRSRTREYSSGVAIRNGSTVHVLAEAVSMSRSPVTGQWSRRRCHRLKARENHAVTLRHGEQRHQPVLEELLSPSFGQQYLRRGRRDEISIPSIDMERQTRNHSFCARRSLFAERLRQQ